MNEFSLKSLLLRSFLGVDTADIDLSAPVTLLLGPNRGGKSSVCHAIEFALTGLSRGTSKMPEAVAFRRDGGDGPLDVTLCVGKSKFHRSASTRGRMRMPWSLDVVQAVCDPSTILSRGRTGRQRLFASVKPAHGTIGDMLRSVAGITLPDEGVFREIGMLRAVDIDKAERLAVAGRREAKRALAEIPSEAPKKVEVTVPGGPIKIDCISASDIHRSLDTLNREYHDLVRKRGGGNLISRTDADARLAEANESLQSDGRPVNQEEAEAARTFVGVGEKKLRQHTDARDAAKKKLAKAESVMRGFQAQESSGRCPTCGSEITSAVSDAVREQVGRDAAAAAEDLRVAETKVSDLSAEITMAKQTVDGFDAAMKEWSAAREAAVAERAAAVADIEALQLAEEIEPKLEEYERRIANGRDLLRIRAEYDHAVKMYDESVGRRERVEHDLDLCDSIASQLGKDGMCRQDAVGASAGVLVPDADLLRRWGMVVALDGAGDVSINSRPFWLASTSEQWRAAAAIAAGIARLTTRWVILDGADILDVAGRSVLSDWAISRPPGLLSVVIGAVSPPISEAKVRALRAVHVRVCWAEDGQVRVLGEDDNGKPEAENEADATQAVEAAT